MKAFLFLIILLSLTANAIYVSPVSPFEDGGLVVEKIQVDKNEKSNLPAKLDVYYPKYINNSTQTYGVLFFLPGHYFLIIFNKKKIKIYFAKRIDG